MYAECRSRRTGKLASGAVRCISLWVVRLGPAASYRQQTLDHVSLGSSALRRNDGSRRTTIPPPCMSQRAPCDGPGTAHLLVPPQLAQHRSQIAQHRRAVRVRHLPSLYQSLHHGRRSTALRQSLHAGTIYNQLAMVLLCSPSNSESKIIVLCSRKQGVGAAHVKAVKHFQNQEKYDSAKVKHRLDPQWNPTAENTQSSLGQEDNLHVQRRSTLQGQHPK